MPTFSFSSIQEGLLKAASHLVALAAGAEESISTFRHDHPFVDQALTLAEQDFPGLKTIENAAHTVIAIAQTSVSALQASVATVTVAPSPKDPPPMPALGDAQPAVQGEIRNLQPTT